MLSLLRLAYFGRGLGNDKTLQEPFLRVHLTAALAAGEGEIHVASVSDVGTVSLALWYAAVAQVWLLLLMNLLTTTLQVRSGAQVPRFVSAHVPW